MLHKSLVLLFTLPFALGVTAQTMSARQALWADSLARIEAAGIQQQFQLSTSQAESLRQAWLQGYTARKLVFARYWKTDSFPRMLVRADWLKDSLYIAILGQRQFHDYKDTLYRRRERYLGKTSLSRKPAQP
jgi:hypothetical protein